MTLRPVLLSSVVVLVCAAAGGLFAPVAGAAGWSRPVGFTAFPAESPEQETGEPVARAGIAGDGTGAVAWVGQRGGLAVSTGDARGRFAAPRTVDRSGAGDWSVAAAPGGAVLVAWEDREGIRVAVRTRARRGFVIRRVAASTGSAINGLQVAADPRGGWVIAERVFPRRGSGLPYRVRALSLDAAGRPIGPIQDLGLGRFGIDARPTAALAVDAAGTAFLVFKREASGQPVPTGGNPTPVVVASRRHGGRFTDPVTVDDMSTDPRVAVAPGGTAFVAVTQTRRCGDSGCFGGPAFARVAVNGAPGPLAGPPLDHPNRAFGPSVAPTANSGGVLVFQLKDAPDAFSREAPVRAVAFRSDGTFGGLQTLTAKPATEPLALPLSAGRVLAVWAGRRGLGAALAGPSGQFRATAAPLGPPPAPYHSNSTNRDIGTAGRYAILAWSRAGRVRVSIRAF